MPSIQKELLVRCFVVPLSLLWLPSGCDACPPGGPAGVDPQARRLRFNVWKFLLPTRGNRFADHGNAQPLHRPNLAARQEESEAQSCADRRRRVCVSMASDIEIG